MKRKKSLYQRCFPRRSLRNVKTLTAMTSFLLEEKKKAEMVQLFMDILMTRLKYSDSTLSLIEPFLEQLLGVKFFKNNEKIPILLELIRFVVERINEAMVEYKNIWG